MHSPISRASKEPALSLSSSILSNAATYLWGYARDNHFGDEARQMNIVRIERAAERCRSKTSDEQECAGKADSKRATRARRQTLLLSQSGI